MGPTHRHVSTNSSNGDLRNDSGSPVAANLPADTSSPSVSNDERPEPGKRSSTVMAIPTALTVLRLFAIPPVVWLFQSAEPSAALWASTVFVGASLTDWLDGYLARKLGASSSFGAFLDPVADKLMVCSVLVLLCTKSFATGLFATAPWLLHSLAVTIVCREVAMSALREWAASLGPEARSVVAVNSLGKWKTALQLTSVSLLLAAMNGGEGAVVAVGAAVGPWGLIGAAALTVHSFATYTMGLSRFMKL